MTHSRGLHKRAPKNEIPYHRRPEYRTWQHIIGRCYNPLNQKYPRYGGRGIKMCEQWRNDFPMFFRDVGQRPSALHSINRINNDGDYEPGNVEWATQKEQSLNRSSNQRLTFNGKTLSISEWARRIGVSMFTLYMRRRRGWPDEKILSTPVMTPSQDAMLNNQKTEVYHE